MPAKVVVRKSRIQGTGVFATARFLNGRKVFKFSDREITINHRPGCHCATCKRCIQVGKSGWLYPKPGSAGWFLNHSCSPSCAISGKWIIAIRKIESGQEISIDYSTTTDDEKWKMACRCKQRYCRKTIRSVQFLSPMLFGKYRGKMPKYVEKQYLLSARGKSRR